MGFKPDAVFGLFLAIAAGGFATRVQGGIPDTERAALIALHNSTDGANWSDNSGWLGAAGSEFSWFGVICNADETDVQELALNDNQLMGPIPAELGNLSDLTDLNLFDNQLSGEIPPSWATWPAWWISTSASTL